MIRIGVIGYGYWGPNLARNFALSSRFTVAGIADHSHDRRTLASQHHPGIDVYDDAGALLDDPTIDALAIATPVASHHALARAALAGGKHAWVEKPLATTAAACRDLINLAETNRRVLHVDHTFLYTPAVRKIRSLVTEGRLGDLYYYDSVRVNLGLFQPDVNVLWDLAVHDLTIMDFLLDARPTSVSATGMAHIAGQPTNLAYLTCFFDTPLIAHIHVNWLAPAKIRRMLLGGDRQMIVYDDLEPSEKIKVYDRGILLDTANDAHSLRVDYRAGDMWSPHLERSEALAVAADHFADCIEDGMPSSTDGHAGLRVVSVLEAADRSLAQRGAPVAIDPAE